MTNKTKALELCEQIKLRECPFCGSNAIEIDVTDDGFVGTPYCTECGVLTSTIEEWNTRTEDNSIAKALGEIRKKIKTYELTGLMYDNIDLGEVIIDLNKIKSILEKGGE